MPNKIIQNYFNRMGARAKKGLCMEKRIEKATGISKINFPMKKFKYKWSVR